MDKVLLLTVSLAVVLTQVTQVTCRSSSLKRVTQAQVRPLPYRHYYYHCYYSLGTVITIVTDLSAAPHLIHKAAVCLQPAQSPAVTSQTDSTCSCLISEFIKKTSV